MPSAGFEPAVPASERLHTYTLDRAATVTDNVIYTCVYGAVYVHFLFITTVAGLQKGFMFVTNINGNLNTGVRFMCIFVMEPDNEIKRLSVNKTAFTEQSGISYMEQLYNMR